MIITNKSNLPEPLYRAICNDSYKPGKSYATVTSLLKPTRMFWLQKRHYSEIVQDASDMIYMLMGSAIHSVLERGDHGSSLAEERLKATVSGKVISGAIDIYEAGVIMDYKFTSTWAYLYRDASKPDDWEKQLNMYAYLYRQAGFPVNALQIICIFRDWSATKQKHDIRYPNQVEVIKIPLWDESRQISFLEGKINELTQHEETPDDLLPECSMNDRWQDPVIYAVKKIGKKKAKKLIKTSLADAEAYADSCGKDFIVEVRESVPKRCEGYCSASGFCSWYQGYLETRGEEESNED